MKRDEYTVEDITNIVVDSFGILTNAAKKLGVSRQTLHQWIRDEPKLSESLTESEHKYKDYIESKLIANIKAGKERTILYVAGCKLRDRGYGLKVNIRQETGIAEDLDELNEDELQIRAAKLAAKIESFK
tara:strand:+ start:674 stop:1063 length:390 start_codon:yes stop_codon:yes gene_type:complete